MTDGRVGTYIGNLRQQRGFQLAQVCEGLCTEQMLSYYENGKRKAPKLLQDTLLERLGVGAEDYEHYLDYREYDHWTARQKILHCIAYGETGQADGLLEQYRVTYVKDEGGDLSVGARLERQFYLSMRAQIRCLEGAGREELYLLLEEAVRMTMPHLWDKSPGKRIFSIKELNLILEAEQYREEGEQAGHYRKVLSYIRQAGLDGVGKAKIYPKAVYFLCRCLFRERMEDESRRQGEEREAPNRERNTEGSLNRETEAGRDSGSWEQQLLKYCNTAVECLRDNSRMYYLWELLGMRERLLCRMAEGLAQKGEQGKAGTLNHMRQENAEWKGVLESVYEEFKIPRETVSWCYLYVEKGIACINDVIRIRRKMFGMSAGELCQGICDVKTVRRLENRKAVSQRAIVEMLFERLGLSGEMTRTELVTEEPEARLLMEQLRRCINDRRMEEAKRLHGQIKELVSAEIRCNQQALARQEISLGKKQEDAGIQYRQLLAILQLTLPYECFLQRGEKYLTYEEQSCIQNMMQRMDKKSSEFLTCMERFEEIYEHFSEHGMIETRAGMYEFMIGYVGSERGNQGDFDKADSYSESIVRECLCFRRLRAIAGALYDRWWNGEERKRKGIPVDKTLDNEIELTRCLILSKLDKRKQNESFYKKVLIRKMEETE